MVGKIYTAPSIKWHNEGHLEQTGSAPNYLEDTWSLATCKHHMRSRGTFRECFDTDGSEPYVPTKPVFVYTVAGKAPHDDGQNALASVAMVTRGFETMEGYGKFLQRNYPCAFEARRTRDADSSGIVRERARTIGDCHTDETLDSGKPSNKHQHVASNSERCYCGDSRGADECTCEVNCGTDGSNSGLYNRDLDMDHINCFSAPGYWIDWDSPSLVATTDTGNRVGRAPAGLNIHTFETVEEYIRALS